MHMYVLQLFDVNSSYEILPQVIRCIEQKADVLSEVAMRDSSPVFYYFISLFLAILLNQGKDGGPM